MREIKFRAWDRDHGEMVYQSPTVDAAKILSRYDVVMQYTGLRDRNGKEIFEGDICVFEHMNCYSVERIFWNGQYCRFDTEQRDGLEEGWLIEVIGNIHENPELLQEVQP
jgi:hypothetical protein